MDGGYYQRLIDFLGSDKNNIMDEVYINQFYYKTYI